MTGSAFTAKDVVSRRGHAPALATTWFLDHEVRDPLLEERLRCIRAQLTAAPALHAKLAEMGFAVAKAIDLRIMVAICQDKDILNRREAGVLMQINRETNEAKHALVVHSRV